MDYKGSNVRNFLHANGKVVLERVDNNYDLRSFTQKEIEDITNGYHTVLEEGGFGMVYKGILEHLRPVAVKRYKNGTKKEVFAKEVRVHSQINHKNVVRLSCCCTEENALTIVMEFVCHGNLYNILHCNKANGPVPFPSDKRLDIAIESAEVLSYMHSMYSPVLHGDIKPANILLDEKIWPKISDFGIARMLSAEENQYTGHVIGCKGYMDPLFCQSGILTTKSDVYSFGVLLLEIITRKKAVNGDTVLAQSFTEALKKGKKVREMFDEEIANDGKNMNLLDDITKLVAECLTMEVKMRAEMVDVADRLRTARKAFHQRKRNNSTGSRNSVLVRSGKADRAMVSGQLCLYFCFKEMNVESPPHPPFTQTLPPPPPCNRRISPPPSPPSSPLDRTMPALRSVTDSISRNPFIEAPTLPISTHPQSTPPPVIYWESTVQKPCTTKETRSPVLSPPPQATNFRSIPLTDAFLGRLLDNADHGDKSEEMTPRPKLNRVHWDSAAGRYISLPANLALTVAARSRPALRYPRPITRCRGSSSRAQSPGTRGEESSEED